MSQPVPLQGKPPHRPFCTSCPTPPHPRCSAEAELTRRQIVDLAVRTQGVYGLTRQGPAAASGASNYWLDIHPAAGGGADAPAARVWLLDSGDRYCPPLMYGWCGWGSAWPAPAEGAAPGRGKGAPGGQHAGSCMR